MSADTGHLGLCVLSNNSNGRAKRVHKRTRQCPMYRTAVNLHSLIRAWRADYADDHTSWLHPVGTRMAETLTGVVVSDGSYRCGGSKRLVNCSMKSKANTFQSDIRHADIPISGLYGGSLNEARLKSCPP